MKLYLCDRFYAVEDDNGNFLDDISLDDFDNEFIKNFDHSKIKYRMPYKAFKMLTLTPALINLMIKYSNQIFYKIDDDHGFLLLTSFSRETYAFRWGTTSLIIPGSKINVKKIKKNIEIKDWPIKEKLPRNLICQEVKRKIFS